MDVLTPANPASRMRDGVWGRREDGDQGLIACDTPTLTGSGSESNLAVVGSENTLDYPDGTCGRKQTEQTEQCHRATRMHGRLPSTVRPATRFSGRATKNFVGRASSHSPLFSQLQLGCGLQYQDRLRARRVFLGEWLHHRRLCTNEWKFDWACFYATDRPVGTGTGTGTGAGTITVTDHPVPVLALAIVAAAARWVGRGRCLVARRSQAAPE